MGNKYDSGNNFSKGMRDPKTQSDIHMLKGSSQPREAMSQPAQLESVHGGIRKDVKRGIEHKDGPREQEVWGEWDNRDSDMDLEERVQMLLDSDADLWTYDLNAEVSNGVVHVKGVVDVEEEKKKLEQLLNIEGVRQLDLGVAVNSQVSNLETKTKALDYDADRNQLTWEREEM